jgi:hypothetical protein
MAPQKKKPAVPAAGYYNQGANLDLRMYDIVHL